MLLAIQRNLETRRGTSLPSFCIISSQREFWINKQCRLKPQLIFASWDILLSGEQIQHYIFKHAFMWLKIITVLLKFDLSNKMNLNLVWILPVPSFPLKLDLIIQYFDVCLSTWAGRHTYVSICAYLHTQAHTMAKWEVKPVRDRGIVPRLQNSLNIHSILSVTKSRKELLILPCHVVPSTVLNYTYCTMC